MLARTASRCRRAYILPLWFLLFFFFFLFWRLISEVTERISTKFRTHIHLSLLFKKFGPKSPGRLPPTGWGAKTAFIAPTLNFNRTSLQRNMISTIGNKLVNLQGLPYHRGVFVDFQITVIIEYVFNFGWDPFKFGDSPIMFVYSIDDITWNLQ